MYSTCIFCNSALGKNESLEHFPVGRRLAFDAAKGRLWVVCPRCERWNLTPLDTRWEAIEEAERAYRGMKLRVSTDNIGLARLREGTELVRVGAPLLPEFAAWRYGDQFGKRRRRHLAWAGAGITAGASALFVPWFVGASSFMFAALTVNAWNVAYLRRFLRRQHRICATVRDDAGQLIALTRSNIGCAALIPSTKDGNWHLALPHGPQLPMDERDRALHRHGPTAAFRGRSELTGAAATRALGTMLPHLNHTGGGTRHVSDAVDVITAANDVEHLLREASINTEAKKTHFGIRDGESNVGALPTRIRLALEIMLHQDDERRAMEGELLELEMRWRDAEEIAGIADGL